MVIIRPIDLAHTGQIRARNVHHMEYWNRLENDCVNWTAVYVDTRLILVDGLNPSVSSIIELCPFDERRRRAKTSAWTIAAMLVSLNTTRLYIFTGNRVIMNAEKICSSFEYLIVFSLKQSV